LIAKAGCSASYGSASQFAAKIAALGEGGRSA